jgi:aerobic carbon-monoxide dehydrogenase medium subunit
MVKPAPFRYHDPCTVAETVELLGEHGSEAMLLAGGQSLVPLLNLRLARPVRLVDINRVSELDELRTDGGSLVIGALTRQRRLEDGPLAAGAWEVLSEAVRQMGHQAIRQRGTVGGSLAHADPAAELPAAVWALGGRLLVRGPRGDRELPAPEFFRDAHRTGMAADELLVRLRVPAWSAPSGGAFCEVGRRPGGVAQVGVAAAVALDEQGRIGRAGVVVAGAARVPVPAGDVVAGLLGQAPSTELVTRLAAEFAAGLAPPTDQHGSADYRRQLVRHLLPRAVERASSRAAARAAA